MGQNEMKPEFLAFIDDANSFCNALIGAREMDKEDFVRQMTELLPRLYIGMNRLSDGTDAGDEGGYEYFQSYVDEDYYESVRRNVETLLGPDDTFLETFEEDMKYSETPICASVSELLADIFQDLYNFVMTVRESGDETASSALQRCCENFEAYWSQTLCNVMRPLNHLRFG